MTQFCWSNDGWLVEIKSQDKEHLVDEVILSEISYWIGLTDFAQEGLTSERKTFNNQSFNRAICMG